MYHGACRDVWGSALADFRRDRGGDRGIAHSVRRGPGREPAPPSLQPPPAPSPAHYGRRQDAGRPRGPRPNFIPEQSGAEFARRETASFILYPPLHDRSFIGQRGLSARVSPLALLTPAPPSPMHSGAANDRLRRPPAILERSGPVFRIRLFTARRLEYVTIRFDVKRLALLTTRLWENQCVGAVCLPRERLRTSRLEEKY
jgi:hypothetical protein